MIDVYSIVLKEGIGSIVNILYIQKKKVVVKPFLLFDKKISDVEMSFIDSQKANEKVYHSLYEKIKKIGFVLLDKEVLFIKVKDSILLDVVNLTVKVVLLVYLIDKKVQKIKDVCILYLVDIILLLNFWSIIPYMTVHTHRKNIERIGIVDMGKKN